MKEQDIELYFQDLGGELAKRGFEHPVRIMVVGGVYMALMIDNRRVTEDVDIILLDFPETHNKTLETKVFKVAVHAVASKYRLKREWMNDVAAYFIRDIVPDIPPLNLWKVYGQLSVYVPPQEYILALKLIVYREKDKDDVEALLQKLRVTTREEAQSIVDRYVLSKEQQNYYMLDSALDDLF